MSLRRQKFVLFSWSSPPWWCVKTAGSFYFRSYLWRKRRRRMLFFFVIILSAEQDQLKTKKESLQTGNDCQLLRLLLLFPPFGDDD